VTMSVIATTEQHNRKIHMIFCFTAYTATDDSVSYRLNERM
jgi:hypothetical protein